MSKRNFWIACICVVFILSLAFWVIIQYSQQHQQLNDNAQGNQIIVEFNDEAIQPLKTLHYLQNSKVTKD